jgi:hypothetical protein
MTYFCKCFICGLSTICAHREPELVTWWHTVEIPERAKALFMPERQPRAFKRTIRRLAEVPAVRQAEGYSGLRGW